MKLKCGDINITELSYMKFVQNISKISKYI